MTTELVVYLITAYSLPCGLSLDAVGKPFTENRITALRHDVRIAEVEGDDVRLQPGLSFTLAVTRVTVQCLSQNGLTARWEVPTQAQVNRVQKMFDERALKTQ